MSSDSSVGSSDLPIIVINVFSVSYSGATWINLMLGSHPESFSVGELKSIIRLGKPVDTLHREDSPIWSKFDMESSENTFRQIARISGKRVLVVNNSRKFLHEQDEEGIEPYFVNVIRDGRAVVASFLRKFPEKSMWSASRLWSHDLRRNRKWMRRQPSERVVELKYEDVVEDSERELHKVCGLVGLEYDPAMLEYWNREHYYLGGNRGTLLSLARKRGEEKAATAGATLEQDTKPQWDLDFYKKSDVSTFRDERWRSELTDKQLRLFGLLAGRLNRKLGYPPSLDRS